MSNTTRPLGLKVSGVLLAITGAWAGPASAQAPPFAERVDITALQAIVRIDGKPEVTAADLAVTFAGKGGEVLFLHRLWSDKEDQGRGDGQNGVPEMLRPEPSLHHGASGRPSAVFLVVLAKELCDPQTKVQTLAKLSALPPSLFTAASVRVVVAGVEPVLVGEAKSAEELEALLRVLKETPTTNWILRVRRERRYLRGLSDMPSRVLEGEEILRGRRALLQIQRALAVYSDGVRVAFVIADGFDLDLEGFYGQSAPRPSLRESRMPGGERPTGFADNSRNGLPAMSLRGEVADLAAFAAARGLALVAIYPGYAYQYMPPWSAMFRARGGTEGPTEARGPTGILTQDLLFVDAKEPLVVLADQTGGTVVNPKDRIEDALGRLANTYVLTFQVPFACDGKEYPLEVRALREGVKLWAPKTLYCGSPRERAAGLAVASLEQPAHSEGLELDASLGKLEGNKHRTGVLSVQANLLPSRELLTRFGGAQLRLTVAVRMTKGEPFVHQEEFVQEVKEGAGTVWTYEAP
ncbi:MAG: hypothetical protein ACP5NF_11935, partial [Thermoanaerobaculum sp.]